MSETQNTQQATAAQPTVTIDRLAARTVAIPIRGLTPLLVHNFSAKEKRKMLDGFQGKKKVKEPMDPQADYEGAFYRIAAGEAGPEGYGFPVLAFKAATVGAARFYGKDVSMVMLRQCVFMHGIITDADPQQLVRIEGEPKMREDVVRVGMGTSSLRYRPEFLEWSATLRVTYVASMIDEDSLVSIIDAGGLAVGVGEWRPEKSGQFGTYEVDPTRAIERLA